MKKIILTVCLLAFTTLTESLIIECSYINHTYSHLHSVSCCHVVNNLNILSQEKAVITSTNHDENRKVNTIGFRIFNITTRYFPQGLDKIFINLKAIEISFGQLKEIHQTDLKPFTLLEVLYFYSNDIEILESGLFDYNKNLRFILFNKNKLVHIDVNVFENLNHLTNLHLNGNECIDKYTDNNLEQIIEIIKSQCQNAEFVNLNKNLDSFEETAKTFKIEEFPAFYENLTDLENSRFFQYSTIMKRIKSLKDWNMSMLWKSVSKLNDLIAHQNKTLADRLNQLKDIQNSYDFKISEVFEQIKMNFSNVQNRGLKIEDMNILNELRLNLSKISAVQIRQGPKVKESTFTWEPFWIGVCSVLVLILLIVLLKNYITDDRIISYAISDSKRYNHEGNRVSYL